MKSRHRTLVPAFLLVALLLVLIAAGLFAFVRPHVRQEFGETYESFVKKVGETTVPRTATNIHFVWSTIGLGGRAHICRFEAPVEDCKAYAVADFNVYDMDASGLDSREKSFVPIDERPFRPDLSGYGISGLEWFDVENVKQGITLIRDHTARPFVWIDTDRNVLYSFWTD